MDCDEEETDEQLMSDELYRRVMTNSNRQDLRKLVRSYYQECGSSFDPDLEDPTTWERELEAPETNQEDAVSENLEPTPEECEEAELEAYAEEYEKQAALADFQDIPLEELFGVGGTDECDPGRPSESNVDVDMDMQN
ncbi:hypothetical protein K435DRAFT_836363 [Dendrothele bispora CBS 962.96]|uniref:Uncharacterized protein n=1 Tax=Dendrothele bispora (strain CBS 962.96) TaxID=1314807 RepID=A0A4S8MIF1_DENBC|nr:hypothetical protein K435DRAFT_836363 [Dendrothele bispora CBS 962.96]